MGSRALWSTVADVCTSALDVYFLYHSGLPLCWYDSWYCSRDDICSWLQVVEHFPPSTFALPLKILVCVRFQLNPSRPSTRSTDVNITCLPDRRQSEKRSAIMPTTVWIFSWLCPTVVEHAATR